MCVNFWKIYIRVAPKLDQVRATDGKVVLVQHGSTWFKQRPKRFPAAIRIRSKSNYLTGCEVFELEHFETR